MMTLFVLTSVVKKTI